MTQDQLLHIILALIGFAFICACEYTTLQYKQRITALEAEIEALIAAAIHCNCTKCAGG